MIQSWTPFVFGSIVVAQIPLLYFVVYKAYI